MMPIMIQTAGSQKSKNPVKNGGRKRKINGPDAPPNAILIKATNLPNPYPNHTDDVVSFLKKRAPGRLAKLVELGVEAVNLGRPVVVQCAYGKHRSRAVAQLIGDHFHTGHVYYVHREID